MTRTNRSLKRAIFDSGGLQAETKGTGFMTLTDRIREFAGSKPNSVAVAHMKGFGSQGRSVYDTITYSKFERDSNRIAHGLKKLGMTQGMLAVFMVSPGIDFFVILVAILKAGAVPVIMDPDMGMLNLKRCMDETGPAIFIGTPTTHLARILLGWARKTVKIRVMVGPRSAWGGHTIDHIRDIGSEEPCTPAVRPDPDDMMMLCFTSGNTGIPKGVVYTHGILAAQLGILKDYVGVDDGGADLAAFQPFALFGPSCGKTAVIPGIDPAKPARADPRKLIAAISDFRCTSASCSPVFIDMMGRYCEEKGITLSSLKGIMTAGAPVRMQSLERFVRHVGPGVRVFASYGSTEALPASLIESRELLRDTRRITEKGGGVCVGRPVEGMEIAIIRITDESVPAWSDRLRLPAGQIGEIAVKGSVVTSLYHNRPLHTKLAKIFDCRNGMTWHRMGDVGYLDDKGRLWVCGRKVHRVETSEGVLFPLPCEAVFNSHPKVSRSALVGGLINGRTTPVIVIEPDKGVRLGPDDKKRLTAELLSMAKGNELTKPVTRVLYHPGLPVDVRHNIKIFREKLSLWAQKRL